MTNFPYARVAGWAAEITGLVVGVIVIAIRPPVALYAALIVVARVDWLRG